jgi:uncharacterized protein (DUF488 family)
MPAQTRPKCLYTLGHSRRSSEELVAMLRAAGVARLVDIRKIPRSRTNPQFNEDVLPATLREAGMAYERLAALGGRRGKQRDASGENDGWQVSAFRNYADYANTPAFQAGLAQLLALANIESCAIMCAEAVYWRCHRRIVTDHVLARGVPVVHLLSPTRQEEARLTPFALIGAGYRVTYPATKEAPPVASPEPTP